MHSRENQGEKNKRGETFGLEAEIDRKAGFPQLEWETRNSVTHQLIQEV